MVNSQDIEARLCAYIEGDLDEAERREIERHLDAHPKHRKMIQDLIRARGLIADLPRAPAPADLGDALRGQLERSMLLGQADPSRDPWRPARRLPRIAAIAAVLLVSLGLGSVLYYLLHAALRPGQIVSADAPGVVPPPVPAIVHAPAPLPALPATQPATEPALRIALLPPATQAAPTTRPTALAMAYPATRPVAIAPQTQPATQPDDTIPHITIVFTSDDPPSPTTAPVAGDDDDQ